MPIIIRITSLLICMIGVQLQAQDIMQKLVTLNHQNEKAAIVFSSIQKQTGAIFAYSTFNDNRRMNIKVNAQPLKSVIPILENELSVQIFLNEKYLIVRPAQREEPKEVLLNGAIYDLDIGVPLKEASVYLKQQKILVNTDENGIFELKIPKNNKKLIISVAKSGFIDTTVVLVASKSQQLNIYMKNFPRESISEFEKLPKREIIVGSQLEAEPIPTPALMEPGFFERFWQTKKQKFANLRNITDTLFNSVSLTLLPPLSTNKRLSFNTINAFSINIIGGNAKGLKGVEVGGVYNFDAGDVYGTQVAGVVNVVKDDVVGIQVGGIMNGVGKSVDGVQVAGVYNYVHDKMKGVQIAGVLQNAREVDGLQVSGVINHAKRVNGVQIGGVINNIDTNSTAIQISGVLNRAKNVDGLQIAGVVNMADTIRGLQIGLINIANKFDKGFALGLVNYVKNGYTKFEIARDDIGTYTLGYRSGWAPLHIFYFGGVNIDDRNHRFVQSGAGLGSSIPMNKKWNLEFDATTRNTNNLDDLRDWSFNMTNKVLLGISWQPFQRFGIKTGLTINHFWYNPAGSINTHLAGSVKNAVYTREGSGRNHTMWLGWQVGILL
jgi:hypothetical protein